MKKLFLLFVGVLLAHWAMAQTIVVLDLPNPCSNSGVEEHGVSTPAISFEIFPNPVGDYANFTVEIQDEVLGKISVELSDLRGRAVRKMEFFSTHNSLRSRFETNALEAGVYIVTLRCDAGVVNKKMIKQ